MSQLVLLQGWAHYFLGMVHDRWNEIEAVAQHFAALVDNRYAVQAQAARSGMIGWCGCTGQGRSTPQPGRRWAASQLDLDRLGKEGDDVRRCGLNWSICEETRTRRSAGRCLRRTGAGSTVNFLQDPHLAKAQLLLAEARGRCTGGA